MSLYIYVYIVIEIAENPIFLDRIVKLLEDKCIHDIIISMNAFYNDDAIKRKSYI